MSLFKSSQNSKMRRRFPMLIISCATILALCVLFTFTCIQFIKNSSNPVSATTETDYAVTTNIFNTSGGINSSAVRSLLNAINYSSYTASTTGYTAHNLQSRTSNNSGNTIIFPMGYVNGTSGGSLYWQATYLYNGYLTVWLVKGYSNNAWNSTSVTHSYDAYANSTIQAFLDDTLYPRLTQGSATLRSVFATPRTAGYQTLESGSSSDSTPYYYIKNYSEGTYYSRNENMSTTVGNSSYLWLPSTGEVWNNTTSYVSNSTSSYIGLWGLNSTDRAFDISNYNRTTSGSFSGIYGMVYPSFVRSGSSQINNPTASYIGADGDIGIMLASHLQNSYNVRPACHISLSRLVSLAGYTISASESGSTDQLSINRTSYTYPLYSTSTITFTYTANANYYINQVRVGSTTITDIPTSQPSSYTNAGTFEYRVYRSNNQVNIVLRSVTANVSLIGYCQPYINVSTENDAVTINSYNRTNYFSTTATITVQQNTAYTQRFRLPSRNWIDISSTSSGDGYIGDIYYNFTNENNIITVYFENLTLGSIFEVIFSGDEKPLSYTATGGTATFEEFIDDEGYTNIIVRPAEGYYVNTITVDNVAFTVEYYRAEIMGAGNARIIGYTVKDTNNVLDLWLVGQYDNSNIVFNLSTTRPTYRVPATGGAVTGTVVTAGAGGEARIVGFDSSDTADTDTLTFIAVSYSGYVFSGWEVDGQILSGYGSNASIPYSLVKDKVVTAVFTPTSNNSANGSTDNPWGSDFA